VTEHKTLNTVIHAAFRRDLIRFDNALESFHGNTQARVDQLHYAWQNLAYQLRHHHEDEETIFWPAMRELGADDSLVGDLDGEHKRMLSALDAADASMRSFRADPSAGNAAEARTSIGELRTVVENHLEHEERDLEPLMADSMRTPQMKNAIRQVRKAAKGHAGTFFAWLQDGADPAARTALRHEVPPPVLFLITKIGGRAYTSEIASVWAA
jgi:iron-sulfur cluster repair protein YtfE (RIC family)